MSTISPQLFRVRNITCDTGCVNPGHGRLIIGPGGVALKLLQVGLAIRARLEERNEAVGGWDWHPLARLAWSKSRPGNSFPTAEFMSLSVAATTCGAF